MHKPGPIVPNVLLGDELHNVVMVSLANKIREDLRAERFIVHDDNGRLRLGKDNLAIILDLAID